MPDSALLPDQPADPPDAVHDVALLALHVIVDEPPVATLVGFAEMFTVGAAGPTVTVALLTVVPPVPVQDNVYVAVVVSELNF